MDISGRASTLLLALLIAHGQQVVYVPGRTVNRMSGAYRGEGKTDARDARVIADQARMKRSEGLLHTQALLELARRRVDVLWAMLRDKTLFTSAPPVTQTA